MRKTRWLRYGLASIIVAGTGLGAGLVACGDDDSASGSSSGTLPEASPTDSPAGDTNQPPKDGPEPPKPELAKLTFLNAATDLGPSAYLNGRLDSSIRICFKQGTTAQNLSVAPYPPLPDKIKGAQKAAGIIYGTGGTFPSFGLDIENRIIVPIIMNVKTLVAKKVFNPDSGQPGTTCDEIVGDTADAAAGYVENVDYWVLPQIDAGTFKKEKSYVIALTGCAGDSPRNPGKECGPGFVPGGGAGIGNLKAIIHETNRVPVSAAQIGVQFFHASAQIDAVFGPGGAVATDLTPGFMTSPTDASTFKAAVPAPVVIHTITPAQGIPGVIDSNFFVLNKSNPGNPAVALAPFPLTSIQAQSGLGPAASPTVYLAGRNFVFVAVGDPTEPTFNATDGGCADINPAKCGDGGGDGTQFNTKSLHFLAFPTDPVIDAYKP